MKNLLTNVTASLLLMFAPIVELKAFVSSTPYAGLLGFVAGAMASFAVALIMNHRSNNN